LVLKLRFEGEAQLLFEAILDEGPLHTRNIPISLMVMYWITMTLTGDGELGFDSGEVACETAIISKGSSRHVTCRFFIEGYSDNTYGFADFQFAKTK
jgi:hypothetical protein